MSIPGKFLLCICLIAAFASSSAQVPARLEPRHKPVLENRYVRLLDVHIPPGDTSLFHIHEIPSFFIPLSTTSLGIEIKGQQPQQTKFSIGTNWYNGFENGPLIHRVWNVDTNVLHVIDLEVLQSRDFTKPGDFELVNAKTDFENERLRVYKIELQPAQIIPLPFVKTPMILISASGPDMRIINIAKGNSKASLKAGDFRWVDPAQKLQISNSGTPAVNAVLILLK